MPECSGHLYWSQQQLPEYMQNLKEQLREELKSTTGDRRAILEAELLRLHEDRRRALTDKDKDRDGRLRRELDRLSSSSYTGSLTLKQRMEIQRRLGMAGTSNSTGSASSSPRNHRRRGHRRQMSDPKIFSSISPIKEDKDLEKELERVS
ncbi:LRR domain-containing protein [Penaeus vannamei]|uniref:LRR domain-containing protein n=1 Tax=Penaeus vannamei TaxID=6689 RepID=A0A423U8J6_PENVA|nr:LRR domain-containing protein [Penaeus vannamei]